MVLAGVGLGFRRALADVLIETDRPPAFVELVPENWMGVGGRWGRAVGAAVERYPILCHGLSLSLGSPDPLDWEFLRDLKVFLDHVGAEVYSEHLSFSKCDNAHLHDLLPIPFREEAIRHVSERIREVQDFLERRIAIENVSYYQSVEPEMDEATFVRSVVEEADCDLLLDVNNVYVNAFNHSYDAKTYLCELPLDRVVYIHMAGHEQKTPELIIDTHGEPICEDVYDLYDWLMPQIKPVPVLLERDFNIPEYEELQTEMERLENAICTAA